MDDDPKRLVHRRDRADGQPANLWVLVLILVLLVIMTALATPLMPSW